jgi:hypothetical protein
MEAVTTIDMIRFETYIEHVNILGIQQQAIGLVFGEHVTQDAVVVIPDPGMEGLAPLAIRPITGINRIGIFTRCIACTIIAGVFQQVLTGNKRPCESPAPKITPFCIPQPVNIRDSGNV